MKYTKIASRSSFTGGFMVVFSCCMLATHMVYGADAPAKAYALTKEGSKKNNTFATPAFWKDFSTGEEAPTVASKSDAKGLEYIITNRYVVRTQNASPTIYGHVTVGSTKSPGTIFNKCYGRRVNYEGGLTVVNGAYEAIGAGGAMDDAGKTAAQIGGKIEVLSPSKKPFVFGGDNRQEVVIAADIAGAENTGILIGSAKYKWTDYKTTTLSGDNSKYLGAIEFGRATHITNFITTAKSLGGAPSKLNKEALKLTSRGEATLFFRSSVGKCVVPATRGISLNGVAGGGGLPVRKFALGVGKGAEVEILAPISASGTCSNGKKALVIEKIGKGTLTLSGEVTLKDADEFAFNVVEGRVILASKTAIALTKEVSEKVWLKSPTTEAITLSNCMLNKGATFVVSNKKGAAGTFELDSTCKIAASPIRVQAPKVGPDEICVLKIPTTVKTVTGADFADATGSKKATFRVETMDGMQSVYFRRAAK